MNQLDTQYHEVQKKLSFLNYIRDAFPRGMKLGILCVLALTILCASLMIIIISKQIEQEAARETAIKERRTMANEIHILHMQVDSALHLNDHNTHTLDEMLLKMSQAEIRGIQNKSSMDSIKAAVIHHSLKIN